MKRIICISSIAFLVIVIILILLWTNYVYCSESKRFLVASILTVLGFFIQVVVVVWGFSLGLKYEDKRRSKELKKRYEGLKIIEYPSSNDNKHNLRILNDSDWTLHNCGVYISINNTIDDIVNSSDISQKHNNYLFIEKSNGREIHLEKLSWAFKNSENKNQHKIDLNSGEAQDLMIFNLISDKYLEIPSEDGYSSDNGHSRCIISNRNYIFNIKIVSDDTKAKDFTIEYTSLDRKLKIIK